MSHELEGVQVRNKSHSVAGRRFLLYAIAQGLSVLGSQVVAFVLGIYVVQQNDGTKFWTMIRFSGYVAAALAGFGVARFLDKRNLGVMLLLSNAVALSVSLVLLGAVVTGCLTPFLLVGTNFAAGVCNGIVQPSFSALIPRMVDKQHVDRAQGASFSIMAVANVSAPGLGAALFAVGGVGATLVFDVFSCLAPIVAAIALRLTNVGRPLKSTSQPVQDVSSLPQDRHVRNLVALFVMLNLVLGTRQVLRAPQVLQSTHGTPEIYSVVQMATGFGTVLGGLVLARWGTGSGGSKQLGVVAISMGVGGQMLSAVDAPWAWVVGAAAISFLWPYLGCIVLHTIVASTAPDQRSRNISLAYAAQAIALPIAVLVGGLAADGLQEAIWVRSLFGPGPAGVRAVLVVTGLVAAFLGLYWLVRGTSNPGSSPGTQARR